MKTGIGGALLAAILVGLGAWLLQGTPQGAYGQRPASPEKNKEHQWEYKVVHTNLAPVIKGMAGTVANDVNAQVPSAKFMDDWTKQYNDLAAQGYEFVGPLNNQKFHGQNAHVAADVGLFVLFKRVKKYSPGGE